MTPIRVVITVLTLLCIDVEKITAKGTGTCTTVGCQVKEDEKELDCVRRNLKSIPGDCDNINDVTYLNFRDNEIGEFPKDESIFDAIRSTLKKLNLEGNELRTIENIGNFPLLEGLELNSNKIDIIKIDAFSGLKKLQRINLGDNRLSNVDAFKFLDLNELRWINLGSNLLTNIEPNTFNSLRGLEVMYLDDNNLTSLPDSCFEGTRLQTLNLSHNKFSHIDIDMFIGIEELKELDLRSNKIKIFRIDTLKVLSSLNKFDLTRNPIDCGCDTKTVALSSLFYVKDQWTCECENEQEFDTLFRDCDPNSDTTTINSKYSESNIINSKSFNNMIIWIILGSGVFILSITIIVIVCCKCCRKKKKVKRMTPSEIRSGDCVNCRNEMCAFHNRVLPDLSLMQDRMLTATSRDNLLDSPILQVRNLPEAGYSDSNLLPSVDSRGYLFMQGPSTGQRSVSNDIRRFPNDCLSEQRAISTRRFPYVNNCHLSGEGSVIRRFPNEDNCPVVERSISIRRFPNINDCSSGERSISIRRFPNGNDYLSDQSFYLSTRQNVSRLDQTPNQHLNAEECLRYPDNRPISFVLVPKHRIAKSNHRRNQDRGLIESLQARIASRMNHDEMRSVISINEHQNSDIKASNPSRAASDSNQRIYQNVPIMDDTKRPEFSAIYVNSPQW